MKTIVAYKSKSGYTKRYAEWIAQELGCDIKENPELSDILGYDTIIYGGGMYAGGFNGGKTSHKLFHSLRFTTVGIKKFSRKHCKTGTAS